METAASWATRPSDPVPNAGRDGLYAYVGLGSRGIGWSALGARLLASVITGGPSPLPSGLRAAVDPARFAARKARRAAAAGQAGGGD